MRIILAIFIGILPNTFCAAQEKHVSPIQVFYETAKPNWDGYGTDSASLYFQLSKINTDFDSLLDTVLSNHSKRMFWQSAVSLYCKHYQDDHQKMQPKMLELINRDEPETGNIVMNVKKYLMNCLSENIQRTKKVDETVLTFFASTDVIDPVYWQRRFTIHDETLENMDELKRGILEPLIEKNAEAMAGIALSIIRRCYAVTKDETYFHLLEKAREYPNKKIQNKVNFLLSNDWLKFWNGETVYVPH